MFSQLEDDILESEFPPVQFDMLNIFDHFWADFQPLVLFREEAGSNIGGNISNDDLQYNEEYQK